MLNGLIRGNFPNNPRDRWDQRIRICGGVNEKPPAKNRTLIERIVDRDDRLGNDVFVVNIRCDTDDAVRGHHASHFSSGATGILQHGISPVDMPVDGILIGKHALRKSLADDYDRLTILLTVERVEIAPGDDGNAKRRKKSG